MLNSIYIEVPNDEAYSEYGFSAFCLAFIFANIIWSIIQFLEFRFENDAHLRTIENDYICIDPSILYMKCIPFAKIYKNIRGENKLNLKEILKQKLYVKFYI